MKNYKTLELIQQDLSSQQTSCLELVNGYISNIKKHRNLNAFIEIYEKESIDRATTIDQKLKNGTAGRLAGLVLGIKDNICHKDHKTTASSKILQGFVSNYSATVIERLMSEDAIIIGRLNCDEFAMGSSNEHSFYGAVKNPLNNLYVAGGSSGGSAAAVQANLCQAALGTDTGGSIRQPAAFCGVMGLKPTYGMVSRHGLIAFASSFDQIGPITKSVDDIFSIMNIISGKDDFDSTCIANNIFKNGPIKIKQTYNFAIINPAIKFSGINNEVRHHFESLVKKIKKAGHKTHYVDLPLLEYLAPVYYILTTAEASSNLARYDGVKYGFQKKEKNLESLIIKTRTEGFGKEVKRRILLGTFVLSSGYYDAYYTKAQKARQMIKSDTEKILSKYDYIILPTTPNLPFKIGKNQSPTSVYYEDIFTVQANLSGHPSLAFPMKKTNDNFVSSAQIIGDYFSENEMLQVAKNILIDK